MSYLPAALKMSLNQKPDTPRKKRSAATKKSKGAMVGREDESKRMAQISESDNESLGPDKSDSSHDSSSSGNEADLDDDSLAFAEPVPENENEVPQEAPDDPEEAYEGLAPSLIAKLRILSNRARGRAVDHEEPVRPDNKMLGVMQSLRNEHDGEHSGLRPEVRRIMKDFKKAQKERKKAYSFRPFGIIGLNANLTDIRSDLEWAELAALKREKNEPFLRWKEYEEQKHKEGYGFPYFTYLMIAVSTVMMLVAFHLNGWKIEPLKVNPLAGPTPEVLLQLGALNGRLMIETGSYYRLVTPIFLHAGIFHLLINALVLRLIGRTIERSHGFWITAALFFVPAIGANIISALMQPGYILVGASGGIFGLIGVLLAEIVLNWDLMFLVMKAKGARHGCWMRFLCIFWLIFDLFINSVVGFTPFVDNYAHMGGLLYGYLIALTTIKTLPFSFFEENHCISHKDRLAILQGVGTVIPGFLILLSTVMLSRSDGLKSPCSSCRYISCIPFPFWTDNKLWHCDGCDAVSGQVYKLKGDAFFSDMEIHCPHGEVAKIDIFDEKYSDDDIEHLNAVLHEFCREHCKID